MRRVRIVPAHARTHVVDRALARARIEEHAHRSEVTVVLVAQGARLLAFVIFGEAFFGLCVIQAEVLRQARDVALVDLDQRVAAAIRRAFVAVVLGALVSDAGALGVDRNAKRNSWLTRPV